MAVNLLHKLPKTYSINGIQYYTINNEKVNDVKNLTKLNKPMKDKDIFDQATLAMEERYGSGCTEEIDAYFRGAKWMQERSYSEEDVKNAFLDGWQLRDGDLPFPKAKKKWFNEFKKKQETLEQIVSKLFQKEFNKEVGNVLVQELKKKDMKQTAVEWLESCLIEQHPNGSFVWNTRADLKALFKQAKEMEKQQIIEAHGNQTKKSGGVTNYTYTLNGEEYYNETFNDTTTRKPTS